MQDRTVAEARLICQKYHPRHQDSFFLGCRRRTSSDVLMTPPKCAFVLKLDELVSGESYTTVVTFHHNYYVVYCFNLRCLWEHENKVLIKVAGKSVK